MGKYLVSSLTRYESTKQGNMLLYAIKLLTGDQHTSAYKEGDCPPLAINKVNVFRESVETSLHGTESPSKNNQM